MKKKQLLDYESPTTDLIELRFEGGLLTGSVKADGIRSLDYDDDELDC